MSALGRAARGRALPVGRGRGGAARRGTAAAGFTLLEVVLALVIFSLLMLMVYGAFHVAHRAVIAGERQAAENQRLRLVEDVLGRQIRSTVFAFATYDEDQLPYFFGRSDGLSFVSAAPQSRGGTGLAVVTYRVVDGQLLLEERPSFTPADLYEPPRDAHVLRAVLLSGFTGLHFQYLPHDETDLEWQSSWDARDEDTLPAAVRMTVEGVPYFGGAPWVHSMPLMTVAYGWGIDEFREPPEESDYEDEDDEEDDSADDDDDAEDEP